VRISRNQAPQKSVKMLKDLDQLKDLYQLFREIVPHSRNKKLKQLFSTFNKKGDFDV